MAHIFVGHVFSREQMDDLRPAICEGIPMAGADIWFADDHPGVGSLFDKVTEGIDRSLACIFEVTDTSRANVFLELGFALGKGKTCVLICRKGTRIPEDIAGFERLEYESYKNLTQQLKAKIGRILGGIPIDKTLILVLEASPQDLSRNVCARDAMARGAAQSDVETSLAGLEFLRIISIEGDRIRVLNRNAVALFAETARKS